VPRTTSLPSTPATTTRPSVPKLTVCQRYRARARVGAIHPMSSPAAMGCCVPSQRRPRPLHSLRTGYGRRTRTSRSRLVVHVLSGWESRRELRKLWAEDGAYAWRGYGKTRRPDCRNCTNLPSWKKAVDVPGGQYWYVNPRDGALQYTDAPILHAGTNGTVGWNATTTFPPVQDQEFAGQRVSGMLCFRCSRYHVLTCHSCRQRFL